MNMQFLNASQNVPNGRSNIENKVITPNVFQMRRSISVQSIPVQSIEIKPEVEVEVKRMIWGPAIWFLFHTLAEKIRDELFSSIKVELLNNIYAISVNLPCPMCSDHAKEYLNKINFNAIQSKDDLKQMLFDFHNDVNKRKFVKLFTKEELDEKYPTANTINIINNFIYHFKDRHHSPKLIASDLQRSRIVIKLNDWFKNNIQYFD